MTPTQIAESEARFLRLCADPEIAALQATLKAYVEAANELRFALRAVGREPSIEWERKNDALLIETACDLEKAAKRFAGLA